MPYRWNSPRSASVSPTNACLLAQCSGSDGMPHRPQMLATFTTAGRQPSVASRRSRSRCGWATRIISAWAKKFTSITRADDLLRGGGELAEAAHPGTVHQHVQPPNRATVRGHDLFAVVGVGQVAGERLGLDSPARHSPTTLARSSAERAVRASLAPSLASRSAVRRPMPARRPGYQYHPPAQIAAHLLHHPSSWRDRYNTLIR